MGRKGGWARGGGGGEEGASRVNRRAVDVDIDLYKGRG